MRYRAILAAFLFLLAKDTKWFEVSSDHFLLFTDTSEMKGRRLVSDLEGRVAAFSEAFGRVPPRQFPIEVFLFKEEQDFIEAIPRVPEDPQKPQTQAVQTQQRTQGPQRGMSPIGIPPV